MTWWKVKTLEKKSVEEHEFWQKGDMVIRRISGFRWGTWNVETEGDEPPEFERVAMPTGNADEDSIEMNSIDYEGELDSLDDGWYGDIIWPDDMDEDERERLEELWEEECYDGWEEDGWVQYETEVWFWGPLEVTKDE
jgi:hypothetical protein